MTVFLGTHQNRIDAKGRVSIPASFRATLRAKAQPDEPIAILRPSHKHPCIEAWPPAAFASLAAPLDRLDMFGEDHEDLAAAIYADAYPVEADKEGRIMLPQALAAHAGLTEAVAFMGVGHIFQIWEPAAAERRRVEARERARSVAIPAGRQAGGNAA
ncbi:division/cell wall cluster transcriptional repressor MraZ [Rhizosaccharibacter radicis]|uniref:Transcriptional regulator MraZ n=1 Tax=Rhizosaccharibacter radicis TaxID=2782605 RepID=A0ABT1VZE7_9PROT|nr:division/cell wall cluster transcriptional repressor MraZ [Acetobacteraceae bacterium KSS12]